MISETSQLQPRDFKHARALTCTTTRYTVLERLGRGGTATVHRAIEHGDTGHQREVAIKRLYPHLGEDEHFLRCFVREAHRASVLEHPNIAKIYKLGRGATGYFLSMELLAGVKLSTVMRRGFESGVVAPLGVVLSTLRALCDALDYAHQQGVTHCDISPRNLLIQNDGQLKVIDFGTARASASDPDTQIGMTRGKHAYRSPELTVGDQADHRSDIFSVGVIAYELLTMRPLFAAASELETMDRVRRAPVGDASRGNNEVPLELDAIVSTALSRDPEERFATAGAMRDALEEVSCRHLPSVPSVRESAVSSWARGLLAPPPVTRECLTL